MNKQTSIFKYLWLYWLPLLFLPNAGLEQPTSFGTLAVTDYLIGPYIFLLILAGSSKKRKGTLRIYYVMPVILFFLWWTLLSSISLPFRYSYGFDSGQYVTIYSLLKLGKFTLYGLAGILTMRAASSEESLHKFYWSILISGILVGLTLYITNNSFSTSQTSFNTITIQQYVYLENITSGMMAILMTFILGLVVTNQGSSLWRKFAVVGLVIMTLGLFKDNGRGGWIAAIFGTSYILSRISIKQRILGVFVGASLVLFAYENYIPFRDQVNRTLFPDPIYLETYNSGAFGIDDGERISIFANSLPQLELSPILGTGFFHRGGLSGIYVNGSHNFFLQMFLETGIVGGFSILMILRRMWRQPEMGDSYGRAKILAVRGALIAAFVVGLGGEYFYGGMALLTLLFAYTPVGSSHIRSRKPIVVFDRSLNRLISVSDELD